MSNTTYTGAIEKDGKIVCEKCSGDKFKFVMHADATDHYIYVYECDCGNKVTVKTMRTGKDREYWEGE